MTNIFLVGPMGAGKTTIGKALAADLSYDFYDSDREIERRAGADVSWIFDVEGEAGFRKREGAVIAELAAGSRSVIATGGGAILSPETRRLLNAKGFTVYIHAPLKALLERTSQDKSRPLLQVEDPEARFKKILDERQALYEEVANLSVSSFENSSKQIISKISNSLN